MIKKIFLLLLVLQGCLKVSGRDFTFTHEGTTLSYTVMDEGALTCYVAANQSTVSGDVIIPAVVSDGTSDFTVMAIAYKAFLGAADLKSIVIPETVTSLPMYAFTGCKNLESVQINGPITKINIYSFSGCSNLTAINIPPTVKTIDYYAFNNCTSLTSITIPGSVTEIVHDAFAGCTALRDLTLADGDQSIDCGYIYYYESELQDYVYRGPFRQSPLETVYCGRNIRYDDDLYAPFRYHKSLVSAKFGDCVTYIKNYLFSSSTIKSVELSNSITLIGDDAFYGCSQLTDINFVPSIEKIGTSSFSDCVRLTNGALPSGLKSLGSRAFYNTGLKSVELPASLTSIPMYAFTRSQLTSLTIPSTVKQLDVDAFGYCSNLQSLVIEDSDEDLDISVFAFADSYIKNLYVGRDLTYEAQPSYPSPFYNFYWMSEVTIGPKVTTIGDNLFNLCEALKSIRIPAGVTSIGDLAFKDCYYLANLDMEPATTPLTIGKNALISSSIQSLYYTRQLIGRDGNDPFSTLRYLSSITIAPSVLTIDNNTFDGIGSIKEVIIEDSDQPLTVGYGSYDGSTSGLFRNNSLNKVYLGRDISYSGYSIPSPFEFQQQLTDVTIGKSVTRLSNRLLAHCTSLTSIDIPESVATIGAEALAYCTGIRSISIPSGVKQLNNMALNGTPIQSLTLEDSDDAIDIGRFALPTSTIESVYIGRQITGINWLEGWSNASSVTFGQHVYSIPARAFAECVGLTSVTIPASVKSVGDGAFADCSLVTSVSIPYGHDELVIGDEIFQGCPIKSAFVDRNVGGKPGLFKGMTELTEVSFGINITAISDAALSGCTAINSVTLPANVSTIGDYAFEGCSSMPTIEMPYVTSIGVGALKDCTALNSFEFPSGISSISDRMFMNCVSLPSVNIPDHIKSIGRESFRGCKRFVDFILPRQIIDIPEGAFADCTNLSRFLYWGPVESVGDYAFENDLNLTALHLAKSVTKVGKGIVKGCDNFMTLRFEYGTAPIEVDIDLLEGCPIKSIEVGRMFVNDVTPMRNVTTLKSVSFNGSVTSIPANALNGCTSLTEVWLPDGIESIGDHTFDGCSSLTTINLTDNITTIGEGAFAGCSSLDFATYPQSLATIGASAFANCSSLSNAELPNSVISVGDKAFANCTSLKSALILPSVEEFGSNVFTGCSGMTKGAYPQSMANPYPAKTIAIAYPADDYRFVNDIIYSADNKHVYFGSIALNGQVDLNVDTIGENAFTGCDNISKIRIQFGVPVMNDNSFTGLYDTTILNVPSYLTDKYLNTNWTLFKNLQADGQDMPVVNDGKFYYRLNPVTKKATLVAGDYSGMTSVTIPERYNDVDAMMRYQITGIGYEAFKNCTSISSVDCNSRNTLEWIGYAAFSGCSGLLSVDMPTTMTDISEQAFADCTSLKSINIPGCQHIGDYAFYHCSRLPSIDFNNTVYTIGKSAFRNCSSLVSVDGTEQLIAINELAFADCTSLNTFGPAGAVRTIGSQGFANCKSLESATFGYWLSDIESNAFANCASLQSINEIDNVTSIGEAAFSHCSSLTQFNMPRYVTEIKKSTFTDCSSLSEIGLHNDIASIGDYAFYNCNNLNEIICNESLQSIGTKAFATDISPDYVNQLTIGINPALTAIGESAFDGRAGNIVKISDLASWCKVSLGNYAANPLYNADLLMVEDHPVEALEIPEGVVTIEPRVFIGAPIKSITLPNSLIAIGSSAFSELSEVDEIMIPDNVTTIGDYAFFWNHNLHTVALGSKVGSIGKYAFGYTNINTLVIGDSNEEIRFDETFDSKYISSLHFGRPLEYYDLNCPSLSSLSLGNHLTEIPAGQFKNHSQLKEVKLPSALQIIGDEAFANCKLTEIVVPANVTEIGTSAFAGNNLSSIIMGCNVAQIGDMAFDGSPANVVCITAPEPPAAYNGTFSDYHGSLYVCDEDAILNYYNAWSCWDRFDSYAMIAPNNIIGSATPVNNSSRKIQLSATLMPENVTLPHIMWRSTNPDVASVDHNGLVTIHDDTNDLNGASILADRRDAMASGSCKIIAESLYPDGPSMEFTIENNIFTGVDTILNDGADKAYTYPLGIYNMQGMCIKRTATSDDLRALTPGVYIVDGIKRIIK